MKATKQTLFAVGLDAQRAEGGEEVGSWGRVPHTNTAVEAAASALWMPLGRSRVGRLFPVTL